MKLIEPCYEFEFIEPGMESLKRIERVARTCYKSNGKQEESDEKTMNFVKGLITRGHEAMLEHSMLSARFIVARSIANEFVRHRQASFAQESTRYCKYSGEVEFIKPFWYDSASFNDKAIFEDYLSRSCLVYQTLLDNGHTAQEAREVLPHALKTEIVITANYREWRHILRLRAANSTGPAHPDMNTIMCPLLVELQKKIPIIFDDIYEQMMNDKNAIKYIEGLVK